VKCNAAKQCNAAKRSHWERMQSDGSGARQKGLNSGSAGWKRPWQGGTPFQGESRVGFRVKPLLPNPPVSQLGPRAAAMAIIVRGSIEIKGSI
jgi:hypothetical protein